MGYVLLRSKAYTRKGTRLDYGYLFICFLYRPLFLQLSRPVPSLPPQILHPLLHLATHSSLSSLGLQKRHPSCFLFLHLAHSEHPRHSGSVSQYLHFSHRSSRKALFLVTLFSFAEDVGKSRTTAKRTAKLSTSLFIFKS